MAKVLCNLLVLVSLMAVLKWGQAEQSWANRVVREKETVTNLQFYFHDTFTGKNPSTIVVVSLNSTKQNPATFGSIVMADDPLTVMPDPNSKLVGRAQGLYGSAGQTELSFIMDISLIFTHGFYNGSSLSISGINPMHHSFRSHSIIVLDLTAPHLTSPHSMPKQTHSFNLTSNDDVVGPTKKVSSIPNKSWVGLDLKNKDNSNFPSEINSNLSNNHQAKKIPIICDSRMKL
ncbi:dirigent protein 23-like [Tripterygium wilfordii]|uniref:dirigent protein 23-like n=1 Tax=Tripterygium wilfordii TaxID=458696 RepID=UPI0018F83D11|nr:dirigent protein 23-like [Tripterygium wilfordii]